MKFAAKPGEPKGDQSAGGKKCSEAHRDVRLPLMTAAVKQALTYPSDEAGEALATEFIEECTRRLRARCGRQRTRFSQSDSLEDE